MPHTPESDPRQIAAALRVHRETIVERWRQNVLRDARVPEAHRLTERGLRDHVPELIARVADSLERTDGALPETPLLHDDTVSRQHAMTRFVQQYDLASVLREIAHLRAAIHDVLDEHGDRPDHAATRSIDAALDGAMTTAALETQRAASEALQASEAKYRRIADANVIGVVESTLEGRIVEANDAFLAMTGYTRAELEKGALHRELIIPAEYRDADARLMDALRRGASVDVANKEYVRRNGERIHVLIAAALVPESERAIAVVIEVEAQWRAERALRVEAELRERFVAVLAHDLRQPLNSVRMGSEILLTQRELAEPDARIVRRVIRAADRMASMVGDLLDLARATHGGIPVNPTTGVSVRGLLERVAEEVEGAHPGAEVHIDGADIVGTWDPERLAQAFANLIGNAVVHGDTSVPIDVLVAASGADAGVVVRNANREGPISAEQLASLFKPFARTAAPPGTKGLGLGLYIASEVVKAHGGSITVTSDDSGTELRMTLPISSPTAS